MKTIAASAPASDELGASRLVLRDGTTATVRVAASSDREAVHRFFCDLSPQSHYRRFLSASEPADLLIERFCDDSNPDQGLTLLATRQVGEDLRVVAVASYLRVSDVTAEVAFAVDDRFQGKGIATLLLEQLAAHATSHGLGRFCASTEVDNREMLDVFRDSGFEIRSRTSRGIVDLHWSLATSVEGVAAAERRHQLATIASMRPLVAPRSVAVVGASNDLRKIGGRILQAMQESGYTGTIHAVNPSGGTIQGVPACRSARELPPSIDLAILAVPRFAVLSVVDDCAAVGVRSLAVITAGFAETGFAGRAIQDALVESVRGHGMRMLGPNCMGLLNMDPSVRLNASFSPVFPPGGHVAFSSQSGALGIAILAMAGHRQLGLSAFVSVGNKADVSSNDLLEYWEADANTNLILLYLESFGNPRRFARIARRVSRVKPIVALKAGRTTAGSRAAGSHTAALAGSDVAVDALLHQSGVIRVDTVDELFDVALCLDGQPLPKGRRLAVVTNAGGPGILATDACEAAGLTVAPFGNETRRQLNAYLPPTASSSNPIDMIASASADDYRRTIEIALNAPETDALLVIYTPVDKSQTRDILLGIRDGVVAGRAAQQGHQGHQGQKPVVACIMAEALDARTLTEGPLPIPTFMFPENAVRALGKVASYADWRSQPSGLFWGFDDILVDDARAVCRKAIAERGNGWLTEVETSSVLHAFGVPRAASALAQSAEQAAALAAVLGFPVAAKLACAALPHKTELGAVRLNLTNADEVRRAYTEIVDGVKQVAPHVTIDGVLVQAMIPNAIETLIGITHDPVFGSLVGFGIGGIDVEIHRDVCFRVAPLTDRDAEEMLHEIRGVRLLDGYRGRPPADHEALRELLLRVSRLAEDVHEIVELDLNPVMALTPGKGCRVVDARIRVSSADSWR